MLKISVSCPSMQALPGNEESLLKDGQIANSMDSLQHSGLSWSRISKKTTWGLKVISGFALGQVQQLYRRVTLCSHSENLLNWKGPTGTIKSSS